MRKLFLSTLLLAIFGFTLSVHALTVSPAKVEITADPGETVQGKIEIFNEQGENKTFFTSFENFESRGDSGAPYFTGDTDGLATWIQSPASVNVSSGERIEVPYTISIPSNAKPGGYFAAIFFGSQPPAGTGGGEVTIGGKIGVLVLLRVAGDVDESAGLASFGSKGGKRFFSNLPVTFEYGFNNTGGDRTVPRGEVKIKNTIRLNSATLLANEKEGSVLPNSTRRFEIVWGEGNINKGEKVGFFETAKKQIKDFHFGWYTAKLNLAWGASSQTAVASYHFFVFPWQLLTLVAIILIVLGLIGRVLIKRYNRYIISQVTR